MDGLTEDEQNNVSDKLEEFKKQLDEIDLAAVKVKERLLTETNEILKMRISCLTKQESLQKVFGIPSARF